VCKPNNERRNAVEKDKRLEPTSFTVSASSIIVNSPEKAKRLEQLNKRNLTIQKGKENEL